MTTQIYQFLDTPSLSQPKTTRFWFVRHAIVNKNDRSYLYGTKDVQICQEHLKQQQDIYQYLAKRLPKTDHWITTPLSRTKDTAHYIQQAGYGYQETITEKEFLEQDLGEWQGISHSKFNQLLKQPPHPFWPLSATERPPKGENMDDVIHRVSTKLEQLTQAYLGQDVVVVAHGGSIRAALAHALNVSSETALSFSIYNLSLTIIEKQKSNWHILGVNELP